MKARRYIVKVPVTITACVEVRASSKAAALAAAEAAAQEVTAGYVGIESDMDRPSFLEIEGGWFEDYDSAEIFNSKEAVAKRAENWR